ncbi:MAG: UvrD-helicase domain-containing protein, partial [Planctomycetota bacterium]
GSGKTRVVTHRIARLMASGIDSRRIVALTFTNKAADEMRQRVAHLAGHHEAWISTFHRFCSRLLRRHAPLVGLEMNSSIYDTTDSLRAIRSVMEDHELAAAKIQPRQLLRAISNAKNQLLTPDQFQAQAFSNVDTVAAMVYPLYQQRLLRSNALDFDDLLLHVAFLLEGSPELRGQLDQQFQYLLVDEYQDTNRAQYKIIHALSQDEPNTMVTGDPDQSIYGWRGAHAENIFEFERDFPAVQVVRLEENFRSTGSIVQAADVLIANNQRRKAKSLLPTRDPGDPVTLHRFLTGDAEAAWIADHIMALTAQGAAEPGDFAILYRVNAASRVIEHAFMDRGLPYRVVNGVEFYQRKEIKDLLAYLNLIHNPRNDAALLRIINEPSRGVGPKNLDRIQRFAHDHRISLWEAIGTDACQQSLSAKPRKTVAKFVSTLSELMQPQSMSLGSLISEVLEKSGYGPSLRESEAEQDADRLANLQELVVAADSFATEYGPEATLEVFLEQKALVNETDNLGDERTAVTLMTLHGAKGLEFPQVFLIAIEDGQLPHARSKDDPLGEEEERRLFFVGITRAQDKLHLTYSDYRRRQDGLKRTVTSPFLNELPKTVLDIVGHDEGWDTPSESPQEYRDYEEVSVDQTEFAPPPPPAPSPAAKAKLAPLMTAASMLEGAAPAKRADPTEFQVDMLVQHPEHGPGKVIALSGRGSKRIAKVMFFNRAEEQTFVLAYSPLQPMQAS